MIDDPHAVLGVSKTASQEEIKKAYRQKAKQYHPDLHPNDPSAAKKMNEVNEAYDMLMNPDKYAARREQQQRQEEARRQQQNAGAGYGPFGGFGGFGGYGGYQGQGAGSNQSGAGGNEGTGGYGGFDFGDIFGFGTRGQSAHRPEAQSSDSQAFRDVIMKINLGRHQDAINILMNVPSGERNARWFYLSALANNGLGNKILATEHMEKAVQMDPNNRLYHQLLSQYRASQQTYEQNGRGFNMRAINIQKICFGLCMARLCCPIGRI